MVIHVQDYDWLSGPHRFFKWPAGLTVVFPDGEYHDEFGARDAQGRDLGVAGLVTGGSPVYQALIGAGFELEAVDVA